MCQLIFLGSVDPLPESDALELRPIAEPNPNNHYADLQAALPEARHFYQLGGCQCYFRYYSDAAIAEDYAEHVARGDQEAADSSRNHLEGVAASVANTADYLADNLGHTAIWMIWKWEGEPVSADCVRWTVAPSYFRQEDFTVPPNECVIALIPD